MKSASPRWPAAMLISTAAEYLDTSVSTVERLIAAGHLGTVQFNKERGDRRILREECDAYLASLQKETVS